MLAYDYEQNGQMDTKDLVKVIQKLGIMNPQPHIDQVMIAAKC